MNPRSTQTPSQNEQKIDSKDMAARLKESANEQFDKKKFAVSTMSYITYLRELMKTKPTLNELAETYDLIGSSVANEAIAKMQAKTIESKDAEKNLTHALNWLEKSYHTRENDPTTKNVTAAKYAHITGYLQFLRTPITSQGTGGGSFKDRSVSQMILKADKEENLLPYVKKK